MKKIAITTGDPAGIGPEIVSSALRFHRLHPECIYIVYGKMHNNIDGNEFIKINHIEEAVSAGSIYWYEIDNRSYDIGKPSALSGADALRILDTCSDHIKKYTFDAVVTCPVSKYAISLNQPGFTGHTEYFARRFDSEEVVMSFWGEHFTMFLLTTHLPLNEISSNITYDKIKNKLQIICREVAKRGDNSAIAMLSLNPHAGESGMIGTEEEILTQVIEEFNKNGIKIDGPFPADTFFRHDLHNYKWIISPYHDQGLIPFKLLHPITGVNITLGLPFFRASVDHGTAFDIAGKNIASPVSLSSALKLTEDQITSAPQNTGNQYTNFAEFYDNYMEHVNYIGWAEFILHKYSEFFNTSPETVLELACGTATISTYMVRKGFEVVASDISAEMLKIAAQKTYAPHLYCADMTDPLPSEQYDLVMLMFDSFNYLQTTAKIELLLENVKHTLTDNGMFVFDVTTPKNSGDNFDCYVNLVDRENNYVIHQSEFDRIKNRQLTHLTFFNKFGHFYLREDENHIQQLYKMSTIAELITKSGLQLRGIYTTNSEQNLLNRDIDTLDLYYTRLFFVITK